MVFTSEPTKLNKDKQVEKRELLRRVQPAYFQQGAKELQERN
jgi:hypothetical protein